MTRHRFSLAVWLVGCILLTGTALGAELDAGLAENPHYQYALRLRQLAPAEIEVLDQGGVDRPATPSTTS